MIRLGRANADGVAADSRPGTGTFIGLVAASGLCVVLVGARILHTSRLGCVFLVWNLFLAWVPLALSFALYRRRNDPSRRGAALSFVLGGLWLLFYPNAPYIVTDLIHLRGHGAAPTWFDAIMIFCFALTGLCVGFVSLRLVHGTVTRARGRAAGWALVGIVAGLSSYGIYLGRFRRWNSWDLFARPFALIRAVADDLSRPRALAICFVLAVFFLVAYVLLFGITQLRIDTERG